MPLSSSPVRVLLVDDSPHALVVLQRMLAGAPQIEVVGTAANGREGLEMAARLKPDVVCTDFKMPVMDGLEFTRRLMRENPRPVLVFSSQIIGEASDEEKQLFRDAGALEMVVKPGLGVVTEADTRELVARINRLAGVVVMRPHHRTASSTTASSTTAKTPISSATGFVDEAPVSIRQAPRIVAIGASTGGPQTLEMILALLPADYPLPIVCVQHISNGFVSGLADWLNGSVAPRVMMAPLGEKPLPGHVYLAPDESHLVLDASGRMNASFEAPFEGHKPAANVLFRSVAARFGAASLGVLLTGMGSDGAAGMLELHKVGSTTVAQDEASCVVFGMPAQAIKLGAARHVLAPDAIARLLLRVGASVEADRGR